MDKRGFTLIETIIAILLMAILGLMAAQVASTAFRGTAESVKTVQDLATATSIMEKAAALATKAYSEGTALTPDLFSAAGTGIAVSTWSQNGISALLVTVTVNDVELAHVF